MLTRLTKPIRLTSSVKVVLQRVKNAKVDIDKKTVGEISHGFLVLLGVGHGDNESDVDWLVEKILKLRVFEDGDGKMNRSVLDSKGSLLIVSQFTLYANCKKGTRPSFVDAAKPDEANRLYEYFVSKAKEGGINVQTGQFGEYMEVFLVNDGPVTIMLDTKDK